MTWWVIVAVGAGSFVLRAAPLLVFERIPVPPRLERMIRHAATAVITSIIVSSSRQAALGGAMIPTLAAIAVGLAMATRQASMLRIVAAGGAAYTAVLVGAELLGR
jgi:branched-subunit amino acid transport protein